VVSALFSRPAVAIVNFESGVGSGLTDLTTCEAGQVWDRENGICVEAAKGVLSDEALTDYALALVVAERFEDALAILDLRESPDDAKALNCRGFATRKLGRIDESIGYYLQAVALAPRYVPVREYLGEAYVAKGRIDLAEQQLVIIETLCGTSCEEYAELAQAIEAGRAN
jgi:tetratricopeptide (TPR) repeat protein